MSTLPPTPAPAPAPGDPDAPQPQPPEPAAPPRIPQPKEEKTLWQGGPSAWLGLGYTALGVFLAVLGIVLRFYVESSYVFLLIPVGAAIAGLKYALIKSTRFELTEERLRITTGLLTRRTEEVELYRVRDSILLQPLFLRLVGLGDVVLKTADASTPEVTLHAIPHADPTRRLIRDQVEIMRQKKGVRQIDVD